MIHFSCSAAVSKQNKLLSFSAELFSFLHAPHILKSELVVANCQVRITSALHVCTVMRGVALRLGPTVGWGAAHQTCVTWTLPNSLSPLHWHNMSVCITFHGVKGKRLGGSCSVAWLQRVKAQLLSRYIPSAPLFYQRERGNRGIVLHTSLISFHSECQTDTACLSRCTL